MNHYISLFTLFGSLTALLVLTRLVYKRTLNKEAWPLAILLLLVSVMSFRGFQMFLLGRVSPGLELYMYFLSNTSLVMPYLAYDWISTRTGSSLKIKWYHFWPYLFQFVLASAPEWLVYFPEEHTHAVIRIYRGIGDCLVVGLILYYRMKWLSLKASAGKLEKAVAYAVCLVLINEVLRLQMLFLIWEFNWVIEWLNIQTIYMAIKSGLVFIIAYVLFQAYQYSASEPFVKPRTKVSADQSAMELFLSRRLYLQYDITVASASKTLKVSRNVFSKTIAENGFKNFIEFINEHRIRHFLQMVEEGAHLKLSIMGMAESSGFKSKATFNRVFKAKMGLTPSVYINTQQRGRKVAALC